MPESQRVDGITLSSLEEVTVCSQSKSYEELEFVEQLSKCNATSLKKLVTVHNDESFRVHVESNEVVTKKIYAACIHQTLKWNSMLFDMVSRCLSIKGLKELMRAVVFIYWFLYSRVPILSIDRLKGLSKYSLSLPYNLSQPKSISNSSVNLLQR